MPRYTVTVRFEQDKEITVYARDKQAAEEKACEIVEGWNNVTYAEAVDCEEAD